MNAKQLEDEIAARTARLAPQLAELDALERQHKEAVSREWVAANNVTADQVCLSRCADISSFGTCFDFGRWMQATGCTEPWAEWNGCLYSSAELMAGRLGRRLGLAEHVPGWPS